MTGSKRNSHERKNSTDCSPSSSEIRAACRQIQLGWSERERVKRWMVAHGIQGQESQDAMMPWFEFDGAIAGEINKRSKRAYVV